MKVYIVAYTSGYPEYMIQGVFLDREVANEYCTELNKPRKTIVKPNGLADVNRRTRYGDGHLVEEYPINCRIPEECPDCNSSNVRLDDTDLVCDDCHASWPLVDEWAGMTE